MSLSPRNHLAPSLGRLEAARLHCNAATTSRRRAGAPPASPPSTPCLHRRRATTETRPYPQSLIDVVVFAAPTCAPRRSRSTTTAPSGRPPRCLLLFTVRHRPCLDGLRQSRNRRGHVLAVLHVEPPPAVTSSPRHGSTSPCTAILSSPPPTVSHRNPLLAMNTETHRGTARSHAEGTRRRSSSAPGHSHHEHARAVDQPSQIDMRRWRTPV